ncbi:hypothetical protein VP01_1074g3 [Puccinia sorghi]|uniref:Uncharacterized protein n=1 Tax=Puccinia sorghi TaxID=27349 RepID=A0A0L6VTJ5_9BASI|nr:hypothetical protein VP01_1074g3 [Puccinia sorghi]
MEQRKHVPPLTSPLAHPGQRPAKGTLFGARACFPKQCILIDLSLAPLEPAMTASHTHQYRLTREGMVLLACHPIKDIESRELPNHLRRPSRSTTPIQ